MRFFQWVHVASSLLICSAVYAADTPLKLPTVTKAFDVFEQYPDSVPSGTVVMFTKKKTTPASRIVGLQARLFALGDQEARPGVLETVDDCNLYLSKVIPLTKSGDNSLMLSRVGEAWLRPTNSGNSVKKGRYYIVFEKTGPTEPQFRLKASDADTYFGSGFLLVVEANGADLNKVTTEYKKVQSMLEVYKLEIDDPSKNFPCYRYAKYADGSDSLDSSSETLALCRPVQSQQEAPHS